MLIGCEWEFSISKIISASSGGSKGVKQFSVQIGKSDRFSLPYFGVGALSREFPDLPLTVHPTIPLSCECKQGLLVSFAPIYVHSFSSLFVTPHPIINHPACLQTLQLPNSLISQFYYLRLPMFSDVISGYIRTASGFLVHLRSVDIGSEWTSTLSRRAVLKTYWNTRHVSLPEQPETHVITVMAVRFPWQRLDTTQWLISSTFPRMMLPVYYSPLPEVPGPSPTTCIN